MIWLLAACERDRPARRPPPVETSGPPAELALPPEAPDLDPAPGAARFLLRPEAVGDGYGYATDGLAASSPGPTLRVARGDRVVVDVENGLGAPTTVHWHGVHAPAASDGAGWPMPEIPPGVAFRAEFTADVAGTFWYHPHFDTAHQVDRGLYGALVVTDPTDPAVDVDAVFVLDQLAEVEDDPARAAHPGDDHAGDPLADWVVNGAGAPAYAWPSGTVVRARFVNASNAGYAWLRDQETIGGDQGLREVATFGDLLLAPGDRADVLWRVGEGGFDLLRGSWTVAGGAGDALRDDDVLLSVTSDGGPRPPAPAFAFRAIRPTPDPGDTTVRYLLSGSAALGWEMNGETFPDVTVASLGLGEEAVIEVRNASAASHPFHVHGHAFEVLSLDGAPPAFRTIDDTVDVPIRGIARLRLIADNPGLWMTHCHVLPHADGGMMTLLEVRDR